MYGSECAHLVDRLSSASHAEDAPANHDRAVVGGNGPVGEVGIGIVELLEQVFLRDMLILMVDGLSCGHQIRPRLHLAAVQRPPVKFPN